MSRVYELDFQRLLELKRPQLILEKVLKLLDRPDKRADFLRAYIEYLEQPEQDRLRRGRTAKDAALENIAFWIGFASTNFSSHWYREIPELAGKHPCEQDFVAA
jgi:23S rRNA maturation mini-RNase III